ncbi:MAG: hypothetical protein AAF328_00235 [Planctomycetota bacterium]
MSATLSKKDKKQLRKQMMQRKQELLAKQAQRNSGGLTGNSSGIPGPRPGDSGAYRTFSDVKPKLPTYTPSPPGTPAKPAAKSKPKSNAKAKASRVSWRDRARPAIKTKTPPKAEAVRATAPARPIRVPSRPAAPAQASLQVLPSNELPPGVLQRSAARIEAGAARIAALRHYRPPRIPWEKLSVDATAPAFGTLRAIVWPMRLCGLVAVGGAAKLALEAQAAGFSAVAASLVFGLGLAVAVGVLALAEICRVLHHLGRAH